MIPILYALVFTAVPAPAPPAAVDLLAIRVGRAETVSHGTIEHAVVLVEGGKIVEVGEDLPIERGIPVLDRPDWVLTPGLVNAYTRVGLDSRSGKSVRPHRSAAEELFPDEDVYGPLLEAGVTTLGLYPAGTGVPGQAVAVRTQGDSDEEMILQDGVYLKLILETNAKSKNDLRKLFEEADKYDEKVKKARDKWEKEQEKAKKKKKSKSKSKKDDDEKKDDEDEEEEDEKESGEGEFVPPEPDPEVKPVLALRAKELTALVRIQKASDYLHLLDVLEEEDVHYHLRVPLRNDIDLYEVKERIGEKELSIVLDPEITFHPSTRRERNLPAEFAAAGARVVLVPGRDSVQGHERWLNEVGHLVSLGLDRDAALAAITLEAARVLGLEERLGSIEKGKDANLVFWSGDPFEAGTRVRAVMLEGRLLEEDAD